MLFWQAPKSMDSVGNRNAHDMFEQTGRNVGFRDAVRLGFAGRMFKGASILRTDTLGLVYAAIDEVNAQSANGAVLQKAPDAALLAGKNGVDSLTFVNLVVALEEQIQTTTGNSVTLVDEDSMALQEHPFRTVGALADYVGQVLARTRAN
jgi:D-alanine--poly(phosphoribitol) ligase subunit 2